MHVPGQSRRAAIATNFSSRQCVSFLICAKALIFFRNANSKLASFVQILVIGHWEYRFAVPFFSPAGEFFLA